MSVVRRYRYYKAEKLEIHTEVALSDRIPDLLRKTAGGKIVKAKAREFGAFPTWRLLIMKKFIPIVCMSILAVVTAKAQDPVKVDPAHFKVILDNKQVRIMDVRIKPGEKTPMHSHPNHVIYSLAGGTTKFTLADGKTETVTSKAGKAVWHNAETHVVENVGKTETHALDIELNK